MCMAIATLEVCYCQITYFPERHAEWETRSSDELSFDQDALDQAVAFAEAMNIKGQEILE